MVTNKEEELLLKGPEVGCPDPRCNGLMFISKTDGLFKCVAHGCGVTRIPTIKR